MIIVTINNQTIKMKKLPFALLAFCCGATLISAKDYKITQNANWMMTLNGEAFHQSRMGKFIMGKINEAPNLHQKMQGLKNAFGVDLMGIREVYAFGTGEKDQGTAFLHGGINSKQLEGFASLNDKVEIDEYENTKTYKFQKGTLGILSKDSVVVASNKDLLKESLKVKSGDKKNALHTFLDSIEKKQEPIISIGANLLKVSKLEKKIKPEQEIILKKFKNMVIFLDETEDHIKISSFLQATKSETANHLENIFRSWPSLLALVKGANKELDEVMQNVEFSVTRDGKTVGITTLVSHAFFESKVEEELEKKKKKREDSK
jgi:hypothetical protein